MNLEGVEEFLTGGTELGWSEVLMAVILLAVGAAASFLIGRWKRRLIGRPGGQSEQVIELGARIAQVLVMAVFVGLALARLGSDIGFLTITVLLAVLIAVLAARPVIEGMGASAAMSTRPAFSVSDEIAVDEMVGEVLEITNRSTVLKLRDGRKVHIPNVEMLNKTVIVYTMDADRRSMVNVTVGLDADVDRVERVLRDALDGLNEITRVGSIRALSLNQGVEMSVRFWHHPDIKSGNDAVDAAVRTIKRALQDEGVTFAPPFEVSWVHGDPPEPDR